MREPWPCLIMIDTHAMDGSRRHIEAHYDGCGDAVGLGLKALRGRMRKPYIYYGCEYIIVSPLGQKMTGTFEEK